MPMIRQPGLVAEPRAVDTAASLRLREIGSAVAGNPEPHRYPPRAEPWTCERPDLPRFGWFDVEGDPTPLGLAHG